MIKESKVPGVEKDNKNEELKKEMEQERDKNQFNPIPSRPIFFLKKAKT